MNARREELIAIAAKTLDCEGKTAFGYWIYRESQTGLWVVTDEDMADLGARLAANEPGGYSRWCSETSAAEVDVDAIVRTHGIGRATDLDDLELDIVTRDAHVDPADIMVHLLLRFFRDDVVETIRLNEEMARGGVVP